MAGPPGAVTVTPSVLDADELAVPPGPWNFSEARIKVRSALNGGPDRDLELFPARLTDGLRG